MERSDEEQKLGQFKLNYVWGCDVVQTDLQTIEHWDWPLEKKSFGLGYAINKRCCQTEPDNHQVKYLKVVAVSHNKYKVHWAKMRHFDTL